MSTPQAAWWLGVQTGLALLRVIIWIWDPKFDNYDDFRVRDIPVYNQTHFQGQELAALLFSMSDEYAKHYDLDMPVSLFERLKEQSIYFFLKQAQEIVNGQDLPQNLRNGLFNGCTAVWDFPEPLLPKWLGYRSGSSTAIREPSGRYSGRFVNIGGSAPWVGGEVYLLPVVQIPKIGFRIANRTRNLDQGIWYFTEDERFQQTG